MGRLRKQVLWCKVAGVGGGSDAGTHDGIHTVPSGTTARCTRKVEEIGDLACEWVDVREPVSCVRKCEWTLGKRNVCTDTDTQEKGWASRVNWKRLHFPFLPPSLPSAPLCSADTLPVATARQAHDLKFQSVWRTFVYCSTPVGGGNRYIRKRKKQNDSRFELNTEIFYGTFLYMERTENKSGDIRQQSPTRLPFHAGLTRLRIWGSYSFESFIKKKLFE